MTNEKKLKPKNIPNKIYLNVGDEPFEDFNELSIEDITWCPDSVDEYDIEYVRPTPHDRLEEEAVWELLAEQFGCKLNKEDCSFQKCHQWARCDLLAKAICSRPTPHAKLDEESVYNELCKEFDPKHISDRLKRAAKNICQAHEEGRLYAK